MWSAWIVCDEAGAGLDGVAGCGWPSILTLFARAEEIGSATIASPVPTVTSSSLRCIMDPPVRVSFRTGSIARASARASRSGRSRSRADQVGAVLRRAGGKELPGRRENLHVKDLPGRQAETTRAASCLVRQGSKRRRLPLRPAIRHDAEGLDETLPAAGERDGHPEIDQLIL